MNWNSLPFTKSELQQYLSKHYKTGVEILEVRNLMQPSGADTIKDFGFGKPLLVEVRVADVIDHIVLHTVRPSKFGHERRSDRARNILLDYDTFNKLPKHVTCLDVGGFTSSGGLQSLADIGEFFLITQYTQGRLYAEDLKSLAEDGSLVPEDHSRVIRLADYLAEIHAVKSDNADLYHRNLRDLLGHGEGVMGITDSYPADFSIAPPSRLRAIEKRLIDWRWQIKEHVDRLSQVHGDFHPWNVLFQPNGEFYLLDRSRGEWGDPADDVSAMSINYIFFSLQRFGTFLGSYRVLFDLFWEQYLTQTQDVEISGVIQPFYAWRALVLAHPLWYPNLEPQTRQALFNFVENVLEETWFDPRRINDYLRG